VTVLGSYYFVGILAPVLAELVSCENTALTGAPREGFCLAPGMDTKHVLIVGCSPHLDEISSTPHT